MDKKIKYRIRDKRKKRFVQNDKDLKNRPGYYMGYYSLSCDGIVIFNEISDGGFDCIVCDHCIVQLFTGVIDGYGHDIYDGDILQDRDRGVIVKRDTDLSMYVVGEYKVPLYKFASNDKVVIGNIHQNPELFKQ